MAVGVMTGVIPEYKYIRSLATVVAIVETLFLECLAKALVTHSHVPSLDPYGSTTQ